MSKELTRDKKNFIKIKMSFLGGGENTVARRDHHHQSRRKDDEEKKKKKKKKKKNSLGKRTCADTCVRRLAVI